MSETHEITISPPPDIEADEWDDFLRTCAAAITGYLRERFDHNAWPQTAWPRLGEFVADLDDGQVRPRSMERSHQTGVSSGQLRDSLRVDVNDDGVTMRFVEYGKRFHQGGETVLPINKRGLREAYKRQPEVRRFMKEHRIGWLFAKESLTLRSPARPLFDLHEVRQLITEEARDRWPGLTLEAA